MTKATMPEPVAWVRRHPDGALTDEFLEEDAIELVRKQSGAWKPLITTTQAEAYAAARAREALEEAESIVRNNADACSTLAVKVMLHSNADAIRALLHSTPARPESEQ